LTDDASTPNPFDSIPVGEQRSQGVEVDLVWKPARNLQVLAAYAYTDAEITKDNTFAVGNPLKNVPRHTARVWGTYRWRLGEGHVGVGAGLTHSSDMPGDLANSFTVPGWTVYDAALFYELEKVRIQLNVTNLTDKEYIHRAAFSRNQGVIPGEPLRAILSAAIRF
jgi:iron complex outermembrane receptor protein